MARHGSCGGLRGRARAAGLRDEIRPRVCLVVDRGRPVSGRLDREVRFREVRGGFRRDWLGRPLRALGVNEVQVGVRLLGGFLARNETEHL